ncbi:DUF1648 domain-containing protein [Corynebacterium alimapuense]|uniref:DUF1648 domain-containing protein n=1 Tax=Corynebacterium alimapuense TaxID=1576874 RepID=A0A3M8K5T6_9CORY|nr:DUF1648 domain-containing protein [Corynebacterium alimapuense]RNE48571.1 hypothetical protein C5L39_08765 [Corynebacterium alimapuense]
MSSPVESTAPVPWAVYSAGLIFIAISTAFSLTYFDQLPDPLPVHFNAAGEGDDFTAKSLPSFLTVQLLGPVILMATGIGSSALVSQQAKSIAQGDFPGQDNSQQKRTLALFQAIQRPLAWFMITILVVISLGIHQSYGAFGDFSFSIWWMLIAIALSCIGLFGAIARINRQLDEQYPPANDHERLRWGMFYFNPDDERVLVDQLSGANLTFNFAKPAAWWILAAILAPMLLTVGLAIWAS